MKNHWFFPSKWILGMSPNDTCLRQGLNVTKQSVRLAAARSTILQKRASRCSETHILQSLSRWPQYASKKCASGCSQTHISANVPDSCLISLLHVSSYCYTHIITSHFTVTFTCIRILTFTVMFAHQIQKKKEIEHSTLYFKVNLHHMRPRFSLFFNDSSYLQLMLAIVLT